MWHYDAPLRDMRYVIEDLLGLPAQWSAMPAFADLDADTARQVIDEAPPSRRCMVTGTSAVVS